MSEVRLPDSRRNLRNGGVYSRAVGPGGYYVHWTTSREASGKGTNIKFLYDEGFSI